MTRRELSLGKFRALQRTSTPHGHFTILALDHQDALRRALKPAAPEEILPEHLIAFKEQVVRALAPETSGVLLDPTYGAPQAISGAYLGNAGLLVELEKADYQLMPMPLEVELLPGWNVAKIKRMGADGVKLFFYYNPDDQNLSVKQETLLQSVIRDSARFDIPLYAEPILCSIGEDEMTYAQEYSRRIIESACRVANLGADILKLGFPLQPNFLKDKALCETVCAKLTKSLNVPWVLLSAGVSFESFCRQVEIACSAGASGFIVGRAVWGEAAQISDEDKRQIWLETTGRERMQRLALAAARGRSWMNLFSCEPVSINWYQEYRE